MLTSLDWLVILFMGLAFMSLLALVLMFLIKNKVVRYISMIMVIATAVAAAFFGFMVGITGYFLELIALSLMSGFLMVGSIVLGIIGFKHPKIFLVARILSAVALLLGMLSAFFI